MGLPWVRLRYGELPVLTTTHTDQLLVHTGRSTLTPAMIGARRAGRKTAWVFGDSRLATAAVDLLDAHEWQHKVRIYHNDYEAAEAWLTSTIR